MGSAVPPGALPPPEGDWGHDPDSTPTAASSSTSACTAVPHGGGPPPPGVGRGSWRGPAPSPTGPAVPAPPAGAQPVASGTVGAPVAARPLGGATAARPVARPSGSGGGGGLGSLPVPSGGGGGNGDELVVYAVIAIAVASMAVIGLGAGLTEGMRFDGDVSVAPWPAALPAGRTGRRAAGVPIRLADPCGSGRDPEKAVLRDDEGYGLISPRARAPQSPGFQLQGQSRQRLDPRGPSTRPLGFASHIRGRLFPPPAASVFCSPPPLAFTPGQQQQPRGRRRPHPSRRRPFPHQLLGASTSAARSRAARRWPPPHASGIGEVWNVPHRRRRRHPRDRPHHPPGADRSLRLVDHPDGPRPLVQRPLAGRRPGGVLSRSRCRSVQRRGRDARRRRLGRRGHGQQPGGVGGRQRPADQEALDGVDAQARSAARAAARSRPPRPPRASAGCGRWR